MVFGYRGLVFRAQRCRLFRAEPALTQGHSTFLAGQIVQRISRVGL